MKLTTLIAAIGCLFLLTANADAGRPRWSNSGGGCANGNCPSPMQPTYTIPAPAPQTIAPCRGEACSDPNANCVASTPATAAQAASAPIPGTIAPAKVPGDPLAQVNARRAARGLRPYIADPGLTEAATAAVQYRARLRIRGHVQGGMGDFRFLPAGVEARAAGADWYGATEEFATCAMTDNYTYAGAASAVGPDGQWYHQLFVR